jgi:hypothetical protein
VASGGVQTLFILGGYNETSGFIDPTTTSEFSNPDALGGPAAPHHGTGAPASPGVTTS